MRLGVTIRRDAEVLSHPFKAVFQGFERVEAVKTIFGDEIEKVLDSVRVVLSSHRGYFHVDGGTGWIVVNYGYLKSGAERDIYLDVIHELVHVRQFMKGLDLYDGKYNYVDRPTEIEAYKITVQEARRIGMNDEEITEYLRVDWVTDEEFGRLLKALGVRTNLTDRHDRGRR